MSFPPSSKGYSARRNLVEARSSNDPGWHEQATDVIINKDLRCNIGGRFFLWAIKELCEGAEALAMKYVVVLRLFSTYSSDTAQMCAKRSTCSPDFCVLHALRNNTIKETRNSQCNSFKRITRTYFKWGERVVGGTARIPSSMW